VPAPRARSVWCAAAAVGALLAGCSVSGSAEPTPTTQPETAPPGTTAPAQVQAVVVLDPGHNGGTAGRSAELNRQVPNGRGGTKICNTTGTATNAGYPEHAFNFDVAQRVRELLTASGVQVVLTRPDDAGLGPCVDDRGAAGQRANADAVVSIHADGAAPPGRGFHVAYSDPPLNDVQRGPALELARALRDEMTKAGLPPSNYTGADGLSPRPDLAGLNFAERPAALVECANMRNAAEAAVISTPEGRQRYAAAISAGVLAFLARR